MQEHSGDGVANIVGNKGACAVSFQYNDRTRIAFVGAHFPARVQRLQERGDCYRDILSRLSKLKPTNFHAPSWTSAHDHVFWLGDFNYRIHVPSAGGADTEGEFKHVLGKVRDAKWAELMQHDQLTREKAVGRVFSGFNEAPIDFAPTYRMQRGKKGYSQKRFQSPSYTDRILWHSRSGCKGDIEALKYYARHDLQQSDHRAVGLMLQVRSRLPYINVDLPSEFMGHSQCTISAGACLAWFTPLDEKLATFADDYLLLTDIVSPTKPRSNSTLASRFKTAITSMGTPKGNLRRSSLPSSLNMQSEHSSKLRESVDATYTIQLCADYAHSTPRSGARRPEAAYDSSWSSMFHGVKPPHDAIFLKWEEADMPMTVLLHWRRSVRFEPKLGTLSPWHGWWAKISCRRSANNTAMEL